MTINSRRFYAHLSILILASIVVASGVFKDKTPPEKLSADSAVFTENFSSTTYRDSTNDTVNWETSVPYLALESEGWRTNDLSQIGATNVTNNAFSDNTFNSSAMDSVGREYIAWTGEESGVYNIYVQYWDGTQWANLGGSANVTNNSNGNSNVSIAIDNLDQPHIAYMEYDGNWSIYHKYWNGSNWTTYGTGEVSGAGANYYPKLALDSSGYPHVAWQMGGNPQYAFWNGSAWDVLNSSQEVATTSGTGYDVNFALNSANEPFIVWSDDSTGSRLIHHRLWTGAAWEMYNFTSEISDSFNDVYPSIAFDPSGYPHVVYKYDTTSDQVRHIYFNGSQWTSYDNPGGSETVTTGADPRIGIDYLGQVHVISVNGTAVRMNYYNGSTWTYYGDNSIIHNDSSQAYWPSFSMYYATGKIFAVWTNGQSGSGLAEVYTSTWAPGSFFPTGTAQSLTVDFTGYNIASATLTSVSNRNIDTDYTNTYAHILTGSDGKTAVTGMGSGRIATAYLAGDAYVQVCDYTSYLAALDCGSPDAFNQVGETIIDAFSIDELDSSRVALVYRDDTTNTLYAWVGTVSGSGATLDTTFNLGNRVTLTSNNSQSVFNLKVFNSTRLAVTYQDGSMETVKVFDVSSDILSEVASYSHNNGGSAAYNRDITFLDANNLIAAYALGGSVRTYVFNISGGSITPGQANDLSVQSHYVSVDTLDSTHFAMATGDFSSPNATKSTGVGTVTIDSGTPSNSSIALGTYWTVAAQGLANYPIVKVITPDLYVVEIFRDSNNTLFSELWPVTVYGGNEINIGNFSQITRGVAGHLGVLDQIDSTTFVRYDDTLDSLILIDFNKTSLNYYLSNNGTSDTCGTGDWHAATHGQEVTFTTSGSDLRWCAALETESLDVTPVLNEVEITYTFTTPELRLYDDSGYTIEGTDYNFTNGDTVYIQYTNTSLAGNGTASATVQNATTTDVETVTLTETGTNTGIFRGSITSAASATPTSSNGIIEGSNGETLYAGASVSGTGVVLENFESYADTAAMSSGINWNDLFPTGGFTTPTASTEASSVELATSFGSNTTKHLTKTTDPDGPDNILGTNNPTTTLTSSILTSSQGIYGDIYVSSTAGFADPVGKIRINNEVIYCAGNNQPTYFTTCYRSSMSTSTTHNVGATVYQFDDNPYGMDVFRSGTFDLTGRNLEFDFYIDDTGKLNGTGSNFGWINNLTGTYLMILMSFTGENPVVKIFSPSELVSGEWQTLSISNSDWNDPNRDFSTVSGFHVFVATGDGSVGGGQIANIRLDNFEVSDITYSDTASITTTLSTDIKITDSNYAESNSLSAGTIYFEATNLDANTSTSTVNTTDIFVVTSSGDTETVRLTETGANTNIFRGSATLAESGSPTADNDIIEAAGSATVTAYTKEYKFSTTATDHNTSSTSFGTLIASENQCPGLDSNPCAWLYGEQLPETGGTLGQEQTFPLELQSANQGQIYGQQAILDGTLGMVYAGGPDPYILTANSAGGYGASWLVTETPGDVQGLAIHWHGATSSAVGTPAKLYIWNNSLNGGSGAWEDTGQSLASNTSTITELKHIITSNITNYITSGRVYMAAMGDTPDMGFVRTDYVSMNLYTTSTTNDTATMSGTAGGTLKITDAAYTEAAEFNVGSTLYFELDSSDLIGTLTQGITVSTTSGDRETVTLEELNASSSIFRGSITTASGTATDYDGILQGAEGDTVSTALLTTTAIDNFEANASAPPAGWYQNSSPGDLLLGTDHTKYLQKDITGATNTNGLFAIYIPAMSSPIDFGSDHFLVHLRVNDKSQLNTTTGTNFDNNLPLSATGISVLLTPPNVGEIPPAAGFLQLNLNTVTNNEWIVVDIPRDAMTTYAGLPALNSSDWTNIAGLYIMVATGDGTTGNDMTFSMDNVSKASTSSSVTDTASFATGSACDPGSACTEIEVNNVAPAFAETPFDYARTTTLANTINSGATSIDITDGTGFNASGGIIKIGSDIISYTGKTSGATDTLTGVTGVTQTHSSGATVYLASDNSNGTYVLTQQGFVTRATDDNSDNYYFIVCFGDTGTVTAANNGPPTCPDFTLCRSSSTASGSIATCDDSSFNIPYDGGEDATWRAYVCDHNSSGTCSAANTFYSPLIATTPPVLASVSATDTSSGTIEPGDTVRISASINDTDTFGGADTVNLVVCSDGSTFGGPENPCSGGTEICSSLSQTQGTVTCDAPASLTSVPTAHGNYDYEVFVYDEHDLESLYDTDTVSTGQATSAQLYAVTDVAPVVDSVTIHGSNQPFTGSAAPGDTPSGSPSALFTLTAASTTDFYWIAAIHDDNGDGDLASSVTARVFDAAAAQTSTCDASTGTNPNAQQECYEATQATTCELRGQSVAGSGKTAAGTDQNAYVSCNIAMNFNANASTQWGAMVEIADGTTTGVTGATSANDYEVAALTAIDIRDDQDSSNAALNFGALAPGQNTGTTNQSVYIANVGNQPFDTNLYGSDMCNNWGTAYSDCSGNSIPVSSQKWSADSFSYSVGGSALQLQASQTCIDNTVPVRSLTTDSAGNDPIYFGITLPEGTPSGSYTGQNTFAATSSCQ